MEESMNKIRYADAGMDVKKVVLRFLHRAWIALLAAAAGAGMGAAVYAVVHIVPESEREYRAVSKLYLDFAPDETGEVYQAYNGYTWNDLMVTEPVLDGTMSYLGENFTREEVAEATEATILSDLRLLTITITTHSPDKTDAILEATDRALEDLGETAKEFQQIQTIQQTDAALVTADSRMLQAVLLGTVLGLFLFLLFLAFYDVLDDRILTPSDVRAVTELPFLGYQKCSGKGSASGFAAALQENSRRMVSYCTEKCAETAEWTADSYGRLPDEKVLQELAGVDGMILYLPYGKVHATALSLLLEQFQIRGCRVLGIVITEADGRWLRLYYGWQK